MKTILNILRGILGLLFFLILIILLVLTPTLVSTGTILSHKENPKLWLSQSGIYDELPGIIKKTLLGGETDENGKKRTVDPIFEKLLDGIVTKDYVSKNVEGTIDGTYDWMSGKTSQLVVKSSDLKLAEILKKAVPKDNVEMAKFMGNLKPCTEAQAYKYEKEGGFSDVKDMCIPPNFNIVEVVDNAYNKKVTQTPLVSFDLGVKIDLNSYQYIKIVYTVLFYISYILTGVLIIIALLYFFIFPGKFFKLYMLGFFAFGIGMVNYIAAKLPFISSLLISVIPANFSVGEFPIKYTTIEAIIGNVLGSFFKVYANTSLIIAITGGIIFLLTIVINIIVSASNRKKVDEDVKSEKTEASNPTPKTV